MIKQKTTKLNHTIIWLALIIFFLSINSLEAPFIKKLVFSCCLSFNILLTYYLIAFVNHYLIAKQNYLLFILIYCTAFCVFILLDAISFKIIFPSIVLNTRKDGLSWEEFIKTNLFWYGFLLVVSYANLMTKINLLKTQTLALSQEKRIKGELNILKHQFHSHFNLNFLSYCYSKLMRVDKQKAETVIYYSEILHFTLSNTNKQKIPMLSEIKYIQDQIKLYENIYNQIGVFTYDLDSHHYTILPRSLGAIAEYCLKSGYERFQNFTTEMQLSIHNKHLLFTATCPYPLIDKSLIEQLKTYFDTNAYQSKFTINDNCIQLELVLDETH
jgi:two-component system, LytTR family, sensor kinase